MLRRLKGGLVFDLSPIVPASGCISPSAPLRPRRSAPRARIPRAPRRGCTEMLVEIQMNTLTYATLLTVAQEAAAGRDDNARALLARLVDDQLQDEGRGSSLHHVLFAS